jgi:hypothetical protein
VFLELVHLQPEEVLVADVAVQLGVFDGLLERALERLRDGLPAGLGEQAGVQLLVEVVGGDLVRSDRWRFYRTPKIG